MSERARGGSARWTVKWTLVSGFWAVWVVYSIGSSLFVHVTSSLVDSSLTSTENSEPRSPSSPRSRCPLNSLCSLMCLNEMLA